MQHKQKYKKESIVEKKVLKQDFNELEAFISEIIEEHDLKISDSLSDNIKNISEQSKDRNLNLQFSEEYDSEDDKDESKTIQFAQLGLSAWLIDSLKMLSISKPTEIQKECIPSILVGKDVIGSAKTGSGKTAAFALPILQKLSEDPFGIFALVLTPTRELAFQIAEQFRVLGASMNLKQSVIVGGLDMMKQSLELMRKPHIVVATPGRLVDHIRSSNISKHFKNLKFLVLDESDRMLTETFSEQLDVILTTIPDSSKRQTLLFSATMTNEIESLHENSKKEIKVFSCAERYDTVKKLDQRYLFIPSSIRDAYLAYLLREIYVGKTMIIFTGKCRTCEHLRIMLRELGIKSVALHAQMSQNDRIASLAKFKSGIVNLLISTDVGSRGLDIPTVQVVLNFEVPADPADYIHRVGRTARAGRGGISVSIVTEHDIDIVHNIESKISRKLIELKIKESDVLELLTEVSLAKRVASMHLFDTGFGTKMRINRKKQGQVNGMKLLKGRKRKEETDGYENKKPRIISFVSPAMTATEERHERAHGDTDSDQDSNGDCELAEHEDNSTNAYTLADLPPQLSAMLSDQQLRDATRGAIEEVVVQDPEDVPQRTGNYTGPKGVLADYEFHQTLGRVREKQQLQVKADRLSSGALRSGFMQRQIQTEFDEKNQTSLVTDQQPVVDTDDELIRQLEQEEEDFVAEFDGEKPSTIRSGRLATSELVAIRAKRLMEMNSLLVKPTYGVFREISVADYVNQIDGAPKDVSVVLHLYQQSHDACRLLNSLLTVLAKMYPATKFLRVIAEQADPDMDFDVSMPALLVYRNGDLVNNLLRLSDEIQTWKNTGRCDVDDLEAFLIKMGIIKDEELLEDFGNFAI
ncbi:hypothetical protein HK096_002993 [Nowakowskiella sp. JEL0078]|nr:hypothetical protein HK096_002993 [Nowakowskiella sp. JEL0078]